MKKISGQMVLLTIAFLVSGALILSALLRGGGEPDPSAPRVTEVQHVSAWEGGLNVKGRMAVVCIDGFEYYFFQNANGVCSRDVSFAPRLDPVDRLPKRCAVESPK